MKYIHILLCFCFGLIFIGFLIYHLNWMLSISTLRTTFLGKFDYLLETYDLKNYKRYSFDDLKKENATIWFHDHDHWFKVIVSKEIPVQNQKTITIKERTFSDRDGAVYTQLKVEDEIIGYMSRLDYWKIPASKFYSKAVHGVKSVSGWIRTIEEDNFQDSK